MTVEFSTAWGHVSASTNDKGVLWLSTPAAPTGGNTISAGGFAEAQTNQNQNSTDEGGNDASGMVPVAGLRSVFDTNTNSWRVMVAFAAPPGTLLRCHVFSVSATEVP